MKTLVKKLTKETVELKKEYLVQTKKWAGEEAERILKFIEDYRAGKYDYDCIRNEGTQRQQAIRTEASKKYHKIPSYLVLYKDTGEFVKRALDVAEKSYASSIEKLAARIMKKELNFKKIKLSTSYVDRNISTTITDGEKTVRAFTIIASGMVQKPHYRYLVK